MRSLQGIRWTVALLATCACTSQAPPQSSVPVATVTASMPTVASSVAMQQAPPQPAVCDDDPDEVAAARAPRDRPFVEWIPSEDLELTRTMPARDVPAGKAVCKAKAEVWKDAQGRVRVCTIARAVQLSGLGIPANTYTHFHEDGGPYQTHIARPQALKTGAGESIDCDANLVVMDRNGKLEHCTLSHRTTIRKVECRGKESVSFHADGKLASAVIEQALPFGGEVFPPETRLSWAPAGEVSGGWLREPMRLGGLSIVSSFSLHPDGKVRPAELAEPQTIQGVALPASAKILLRRNGSLKYAEYETRHGFMPHGEPWKDTRKAHFDCQGKVVSEHTDHWQAPYGPRHKP